MKITLNADVGEGIPSDKDLMPYLTYANIACGGHFGNSETISQAIDIAKINGVKIGAHPSYPDKENFGRKSIKISQKELENSLKIQIGNFIKIAQSKNILLHHIKLHGALYNDVFRDEKLIIWFLNLITNNFANINIFVPIGVEKKIPLKYNKVVIYEAFADRNYNEQLQLISRKNSNASIINPKKALLHVEDMFLRNKLVVNKLEHQIKADTFCLHGDNPNVLAIAEKIYLLKRK